MSYRTGKITSSKVGLLIGINLLEIHFTDDNFTKAKHRIAVFSNENNQDLLKSGRQLMSFTKENDKWERMNGLLGLKSLTLHEERKCLNSFKQTTKQ